MLSEFKYIIVHTSYSYSNETRQRLTMCTKQKPLQLNTHGTKRGYNHDINY